MRIISKDELNEKRKQFIHALPYFRFIFLLFLILIIIAGVKLYFTNLLATSGVQLTATNQKIEQLEEEKVKLEVAISKLGSVARLQKEAEKMGFSAHTKVEELTPPKPLAQKP